MKNINLIEFSLDDFLYGLNIDHLEKITYSVAVTPLPAAPPSLLGMINFRGDFLPVLNIRKKCGVPFKPVALSDKLIIIKNSVTRFAMIVDSVGETMTADTSRIVPADSIWSGLTYLTGVYRAGNKSIMVIDDENILRDDDNDFIVNNISSASPDG